MRLKDNVKLSITANEIIDNVGRTETSIDQFIIKYLGKTRDEKIAIDDLLGMYKNDGDREFIQKYVETKSAYLDTTIAIYAYLFATSALFFTLIWSYLYDGIHIFVIQLSILVAILILLNLFVRVFLNLIPKLNRNKTIIMSIGDKWNDQGESHSNPNTKNEGDDDTTMNTGYKTALIGLICGAFLVCVVGVGLKYYQAKGWDAFDPLSNILLVSVLVGVTWYYAGQVAKQTKFMKIDRVSKEMDRLVSPLNSKKDTALMFTFNSTNIVPSNNKQRDREYYEFWTAIKQNKYLGPHFLRSAIDDYLIASSKINEGDSTQKCDEIKNSLHAEIKTRYDQLTGDLSTLTRDSKTSGESIALWALCGAIFMIFMIFKMQWW